MKIKEIYEKKLQEGWFKEGEYTCPDCIDTRKEGGICEKHGCTLKLKTEMKTEWENAIKWAQRIQINGVEIDGRSLEILTSPGLFNLVIAETEKRIVGERDTKETIFLCTCGRFVENAKSTSYHLLVNSESGAGKDHAVSNILKALPKDSYLKRTRISPTVLNYWKTVEAEPEWSWNGKILYLEDVSNAVLNCEALKVMLSGGSHATIVINGKAKELQINGKPIVFLTTASANPSKETLRRVVIVNLDESNEQTKAIMEVEARLAREGKTKEYDTDIPRALRHLQRIKVKIPFSEVLHGIFPHEHVIIRTNFPRFIDYIKASVALHQFQRKKDSEGYYLAEGKDYEVARGVFKKITSNPFTIPLTKDQKRILEVFKKLDSEKLERGKYAVSDLEAHISFITDRMLRNHLDKLTENGFLKKDKEDRETSKKPVMVFRYVDSVDINLPTWEELCEKYQIVSSLSSLSFNSNVSNLSNDSSNSGLIETNETIEQRNQAQKGSEEVGNE